jgi:hypothetical protein
MHYTIAERSRLDDAFLGIGHDELPIAAVLIRLMRQFPLQRKQVFFELVPEFQNGTAVTFARTRPAIGGVQILELNDLGE